jgi:hypothetical protein
MRYSPKYNSRDPQIRLALESLRQQLSQLCSKKVVKIVCPYAAFRKRCCGLKEGIQRLYERLPEDVKRNFEMPNCDLQC